MNFIIFSILISNTSNMKEKFYPKISVDRTWIKFLFRHSDKHFTMRFSWRPMILMEKYFILFWWEKEDFMTIWNLATQKEEIPEELKVSLPILKKAMSRINELLDVFELCDKDSKSPFVIYKNDFNAYK